MIPESPRSFSIVFSPALSLALFRPLSKAPSLPPGPVLDADAGETALLGAAQGEFPGAQHGAGEAGPGPHGGPAAGLCAIPLRSWDAYPLLDQ